MGTDEILTEYYELLYIVNREWRKGKTEGAFEGEANRMWLEGWDENSLQVCIMFGCQNVFNFY